MSTSPTCLLPLLLFATLASVLHAAPQEIIADVCDDHFFHPAVLIECHHDPKDGVKDFEPFLRVFARTTIDHMLEYTSADQVPPDYPSVLYVDVKSFAQDDYTDATQFIYYQNEANEDFVDKLVGIGIDGVPIYTALGPGGYDMLDPSGAFADIAPLEIDECGGTYGPTPHGVRYHYRTIPSCVIAPLPAGDMWDEEKWETQVEVSNFDETKAWFVVNSEQGGDGGSFVQMNVPALRQRYITDPHDLLENFKHTSAQKARQLVGWSVEGHAIYTPYNHRGLLQDDLDNCNGKFDEFGKYAYYAQPTFPYIQGCLGPGTFSLSEEKTTLEMLPADVNHSTRRYNACPGGYVPSFNFESNSCEPCPAGRYSSATYLKAGEVVKHGNGCKSVCPLGHYCTEGSSKPIKCPSGRFGSSMGLKTVDCSGACKAGFYCPASSIRSDPYPCGRSSHYCPEKSPARVLVDTGFYSIPEENDDTQRIAQEACGPGTYCIDGKRYPCPAGRYGTILELHSSNCTSHCPTGAYCPLSSPDPILCPAGRFGSTIGLETPECSGSCKPGYYCPQGSTQEDQVPCAPGRYGAENGLTSEECSPLCEITGAGAPNATSSAGTKFCEFRHCAAGYYCPLASISAKQVECGGASVFCPPSSVIPTPVTIGFYTIGPNSKPENMQMAGTETGDEDIRFSQIICEPGFYCIDGVRYRCPLGHYGGVSGLTSDTCSGQCNAGYLCALDSTSSKQEPCGKDASVYCPQGSYENIIVPAGYYSIGDDHTTREAIVACPPGMYCVDGVKRKCAPGRYSVNGSPSEECDGLCDRGYWCDSGSFDRRENDCPPGRYGHLGMINSACKGSCRVGYYCPLNSVSPTQVECGGEYFYCPHGSGAPQPVSSGFFSAGGNQTTREEQVKCDTADYWGTPPYAKYRVNVCPDTTQP